MICALALPEQYAVILTMARRTRSEVRRAQDTEVDVEISIASRRPAGATDAMTYYCSECVTNWHPYQCTDGVCPECGTGTVRKSEPASPDVDERFNAVLKARIERERSEHNHKLFEEFCAARQPTEVIDALELWWGLPAADREPA